ncbi:MAG: phosphoadenosine phosphosulfate reductase [Synechococcales cyanobacterium T60_A2020_003]|nr:phosphoadenosine phosphosulfate reductase [Synechococcales cyanobacterium T60_A2020_003]
MVGTALQHPQLDIDSINQHLDSLDSAQVIKWASETFGNGLVMSTSFGIQSAVMLHLVTSVVPSIPVIWVDTGYLPAKTYRFAEELSQRLNLNLHVYQSPISPARMEALYGKLWDKQDVESLNLYDQIRKVEPMQRALEDLGATAWLAGLRRDQTSHRKNLTILTRQDPYYKVLPILGWNSKNIYDYLQAHDLPYHPMFDEGYVTVGDWHSSRPIMATDEHERDTRFHGLKQECGIHLPQTIGEEESLNSSSL